MLPDRHCLQIVDTGKSVGIVNIKCVINDMAEKGFDQADPYDEAENYGDEQLTEPKPETKVLTMCPFFYRDMRECHIAGKGIYLPKMEEVGQFCLSYSFETCKAYRLRSDHGKSSIEKIFINNYMRINRRSPRGKPERVLTRGRHGVVNGDRV